MQIHPITTNLFNLMCSEWSEVTQYQQRLLQLEPKAKLNPYNHIKEIQLRQFYLKEKRNYLLERRSKEESKYL